MRLLVVVSLTLASPASANSSLVELPDHLVLEDDGEYRRNIDYLPPEAVDGIYAHGSAYNYDFSVYALSANSEINKATESCPSGKLEYVGTKTWPSDTHERNDLADQEFWFYRHGHQALFVARFWVTVKVENCRRIFGSKYKMIRTVESGDSITKFDYQDGTISSVRTSEKSDLSLGSDVLEKLLLPDPKTIRTLRSEARSKGTLKSRKLGKNTELCLSEWQYFWGGMRCVVTTRGPLLGLTTTDWHDQDTGPSHFFTINDLQSAVKIDGRLFEWDRKIRTNETSSGKAEAIE